ncbi:hypothetical protein RhiirA5_444357 [Rhizophagus irregularis]|uniref:Uncharacterized protein n=1 Tax=Rhizophagus irregularis TaxID=588596 RepID=A0A2N0ND59_9GLOM|nr:hypothetical protein RhiirA5_444357 [Rhizophagus irregularis]
MTSELVQFTFNNDSTIFEIVNFFLRGGDRGKRRSIWGKSASSRVEMRLWKLATSHCNSRKRFKILLASSGNNAELGVCRGKGRAVEREEKEKETDRSLLLRRARWEALEFGML